MKLINYNKSYVAYTQYYKRPIVFPHLLSQEVIDRQEQLWKEEERVIKEQIKQEMKKDGLLNGSETEEEIEEKVEKFMPEQLGEYLVYLQRDSASRNLTVQESMKRWVAREIWESQKGYYDKVPSMKKK